MAVWLTVGRHARAPVPPNLKPETVGWPEAFEKGEMKMRKVLIPLIALSLILVSGAFFSAQAQPACGCGLNLSWLNPCNWSLSSCNVPAAAEAPAPAPAPAVEHGCGLCGHNLLSWLNPCNWGTCAMAAEVPAAVETPAPVTSPRSNCDCVCGTSWLNPCRFGSTATQP